MMTAVVSNTDECLALIKGTVSANQQILNSIVNEADIDLTPVLAELDKTLKVEEPLTFTNEAVVNGTETEDGIDTVIITRPA